MTQQSVGVVRPSMTRHILRLMRAYERRAASPSGRRAPHSRGQTLVIFALTLTSLIGFLGLAIDTVRVFDEYGRMQRAAEAGALAGVIYMPNYYTAAIPNAPSDNAICRAEKEIYKNGFGPGCADASSIGASYCPSSPSTVEIAVCPVSNKPYNLQVYITETVNVVFLSALGVGPLTLTVSAEANYLPPVEVQSDPTGSGSTGAWGTFGECNGASAACTGTGVRNWAGNINGPGDLKEMGDPLVTCAEGPDSSGTVDTNAALSTPYTTYTGIATNHPQSGLTPNAVPTSCGNSDTTAVFQGPLYTVSGSQSATGSTSRAGYAYYVTIPSTGASQSMWIWNAPFSPSAPKSCNGRSGGQGTSSYDIFYYNNCSGSSASPYPYYPGTTCSGLTNIYACTDPNLYFSVTYSVYKISGPTDTAGTLDASFTAWPYTSAGTCKSGEFYELANNNAPYTGLTSTGCVTPPCVSQWCSMGNGFYVGDTNDSTATPYTFQPGQFYRVMVTASDYGSPTNQHLGWGGHSYSLKLCPSTTTLSNVQTCSPGGTIGGWNQGDAVFLFPGGGKGSAQITEYPLGVIDPSFAGRTIDVRMYDPGDLNGTNSSAKGDTYYAVAPPTAATDPCTATSAQLTAAGYDPTTNGSSFVFPNSEPTSSVNSLPALHASTKGSLTYNGLWADEQVAIPATYQYSSASWTLCALAPQTNDFDVLGISTTSLGQSPVHLVK